MLVVDDVAASRGLASIWLSDGLPGGVEVVEAATAGRDARPWAAHRPDIVVLDQRLPDGEGLDGARELLAEDPDATIVLLTGMADSALDQEAERIGIADFLVKHEDRRADARPHRALRAAPPRGPPPPAAPRRSAIATSSRSCLITGVLVVDEQLRFVVVAGAAIEQAGHDTDAMVGQSVEEVLARANRLEMLDHYRDALAGVPSQVETVSASGRTTAQRSVRSAPRRWRSPSTSPTSSPRRPALQRASIAGQDRIMALGRSHPEDDVVAGLCRIYGLDPSQPPCRRSPSTWPSTSTRAIASVSSRSRARHSAMARTPSSRW